MSQYYRVTAAGAPTVPTQFDTDSGSAVPVANILQVLGGTGIDTSGATNIVTITFDVTEVPTLATLYTADSGTAAPSANTINIVGGTGVNTSATGDTVTINATTTGMPWVEETTTSRALVVNEGVVANNAGLITMTLPATAVLGDTIRIVGKGAGLYSIAQNAGQTIHYVDVDSTTGAGGSVTAIEQYAAIELVCITANTDWAVLSSTGNFTIV